MKITKVHFLWMVWFLGLIGLLGCWNCQAGKKLASGLATAAGDSPRILRNSFEHWQVIGSGRNFLTVKIDLPRKMWNEFKLYALILDEQKAPLRKVSSFVHFPDLPGRDHIWFYCILYSPQPLARTSSHSQFIQFRAEANGSPVTENCVSFAKEWGGDCRLIDDLPAPPPEIRGVIELKDYTFLAEGDCRSTSGYYVKGKIRGPEAAWDHFQPESALLGSEPEPEIRLESSRGWLELATGHTHQMMEAVSPLPPYVNGWWDGKGWFHPDPPLLQSN